MSCFRYDARTREILDPNGEAVAILRARANYSTGELFAASPDLLDACEAFVRFAENHILVDMSRPSNDCQAALAKARDAIRLAREGH